MLTALLIMLREGFEALLADHGRFAGDDQRADVVAVVDRARSWYRAIAGDPIC